jgi:hypothetical protein
LSEFVDHHFPVDGFQQTRPERSIYLHGDIDDRSCYVIKVHSYLLVFLRASAPLRELYFYAAAAIELELREKRCPLTAGASRMLTPLKPGRRPTHQEMP